MAPGEERPDRLVTSSPEQSSSSATLARSQPNPVSRAPSPPPVPQVPPPAIATAASPSPSSSPPVRASPQPRRPCSSSSRAPRCSPFPNLSFAPHPASTPAVSARFPASLPDAMEGRRPAAPRSKSRRAVARARACPRRSPSPRRCLRQVTRRSARPQVLRLCFPCIAPVFCLCSRGGDCSARPCVDCARLARGSPAGLQIWPSQHPPHRVGPWPIFGFVPEL
ncbi:lysine-rich arabinogalactan protein 19 [Triticum aestivum]|uniref:lysine-rich arabinogalactan protein 19 n=1 Tax=Triticum aestivum TaxID=4565 RepID=UPI001D0115A0|nr:lysine-rich arabinogalactan protein 19-like [Triticum aestivum]